MPSYHHRLSLYCCCCLIQWYMLQKRQDNGREALMMLLTMLCTRWKKALFWTKEQLSIYPQLSLCVHLFINKIVFPFSLLTTFFSLYSPFIRQLNGRKTRDKFLSKMIRFTFAALFCAVKRPVSLLPRDSMRMWELPRSWNYRVPCTVDPRHTVLRWRGERAIYRKGEQFFKTSAWNERSLHGERAERADD